MIGYIYKYENKINHHIYIGQTINYEKRLREHKNASLNPNHKDFNLTIHKAIRKYGLDNFYISIIDVGERDTLNKKEQYWIKYYNSYKHGYNETPGGQNGGYNGKKVEVYDLNGKFIQEYENAKEASINLKVSYSTIQQVLHKKRPTCKNFQLKYKEDLTKMKPFISKQGGTKQILQIDKTTNQIIRQWNSISSASKELHIDSSSITKVLKGKLKTCGGFKWKYVEEYGGIMK